MKTMFTVTGKNKDVLGDEHFDRKIRLADHDEVPAETTELKYEYKVFDCDGVPYFWG